MKFFLRIYWVVALVFLSVFSVGCTHGAIDRAPAQMPDVDRLLIEQITSILENSTPYFQYDYVEKLKDYPIRGITFGRVGFTSCEDGIDLLEAYEKLRPDNDLSPFIAVMQKTEEKAITCRENVHELETARPDFATVFHSLAADPELRAAQDTVEDERYYQPATALARQLGVKSNWGRLVLYDTYVQHGEDDGGIGGIVKANLKLLGGDAAKVGEDRWLTSFLKIRRHVLATGDGEWKQSVTRIDALLKIRDHDGNQDLNPFTFRSTYGTFDLPAMHPPKPPVR